MIDYTRAAIDKTLTDFKRFGFIFNIVIELLSISYLIYAIIAGVGFIYANIALAAVSFAYLTFYIIVGRDSEKKKLFASTKSSYKLFKIAVHTLNLGITVYGIYIATEEPSFISIVMAAATTVGWAINILVTFSINYLSLKAHFIVRAIEADIEEAKRPVEKVDNFIKKIRGEEIKPKDPPDKTRILLESTVYAFREKKRAEKERRKAERRERITDFFFSKGGSDDVEAESDEERNE